MMFSLSFGKRLTSIYKYVPRPVLPGQIKTIYINKMKINTLNL